MNNLTLSNRQFFIHGIIIIFIIILLSKIFYIQIFHYEKYEDLASNNSQTKEIIDAERGLIYDRNGVLLVKNDSIIDLMIIPDEIKLNDTTDIINFCKYFNIIDSTEIKIDTIKYIDFFEKKLDSAKKFSRKKASVFLKNIPKYKVENLGIQWEGFHVKTRMIRKYQINYAANILGYTGEINKNELNADLNNYYVKGNQIGKTGIEKSYEELLRGKKGVKYIVTNSVGVPKYSYRNGEHDRLQEPGKSIMITIDSKLQEIGQKLLKGYNGSIVAIEPSTGEILCMATSPNYNPEDMIATNRSDMYPILKNNLNKPLIDRSISSAYPPGSTIKMLTALIALEEGIISENEKIDCNYGWVHPNKRVSCHGTDHKPLNLTNAIEQSCNSYFSEIFHKLIHSKSKNYGINTWKKYMNEFGFGNYLNNDLYTGVPGKIPDSEYYYNKYQNYWTSTYIISLAIGQGEMLASPIQLANYTAILANNGYFYTPHVIKKICNEQTEEPYVKCEEWEKIDSNLTEKKIVSISNKYFEKVKLGMEKVIISKKGTAQQALINNINILGKTGTVENGGFNPETKVYEKKEDHSVFIAYAPKENPKIAICVYIENEGSGGATAAPIASLCIEQYLNGKIDTTFINRPQLNKFWKKEVINKINEPLYD